MTCKNCKHFNYINKEGVWCAKKTVWLVKADKSQKSEQLIRDLRNGETLEMECAE